MVRSIWVTTLVAALASAGLTSAQPAGAPRPGSAVGRILTINEPGKPAQKCRVLREWVLPDGDKAMETEDIATGEKVTLVAPSADGKAKTVSARFFHWGRNSTPPPGVPLPPATVITQTTPTVPPAVVTTGPSSGPMAQMSPSRQKLPLSLAPQTTNAGRTWPPAFGSGPGTVASAPPPPVTVPAPQTAPVVMTSQPTQAPALTPYQPKQTPVMTPYQPTPTPVASRLCPVPASCPPCCTNSGCSKTNCCSRTVVSGPPVIINTPPSSTPAPSPPTVSVVTTTAPVKPDDWRPSWGAPPRTQPTPEIKPVASKPETTKASEPSRLQVAKFDLFHRNTPKEDPVKADLPQADKSKPDPFSDPAAYSRTSVSKKVEEGWKGAPPSSVKPMTASATPPPATVTPTGPASSLQSTLGRGELPSGPGGTLPASAAPQQLPLGAQSVLAAGNPPYVPVPIVTLPDVHRNPAPPPARLPEAPQPNKALMENAFYQAANSPPPIGMALDKSGGNAFSPPPSPGEEQAAASAFGQQTMSPRGMMAARTPLPPAPFAPAGQPMAYHPPAVAYAMSYGQGVMPAGYSVPPASGWRPAVPMQSLPQAAHAPAPAGPDTRELMGALQDSLYPSQREWAAEQLAKVDWHTHGAVIDALVKAAKEDPAASVRASCVHVLARMNVNTVPVVTAVQSLKSDIDPRVQTAAQEALVKLAPGQATGTSHATDSAVQPASATMPAKP